MSAQVIPPFIIAEMSGNHNQSLERAIQIVDEAAKAGVNAVKIQTYTADTMTLDVELPDFLIKETGSLWKGKSLYRLYQEAFTPWEWHEPIFNRCKELGIIGFSTPFDLTALEFLEKLNCPIYKIASFENTDLPLIKKVASTQKPLIISTGMATISELEETVETVRQTGNEDITLLKCTSSYPADCRDSNLRTIPHLKGLFGTKVGLSDHTLGIGVAVASVALGATMIEKHFTLSRAEKGVDSAFSLEPAEMKSLVEETKRAVFALGKISYRVSDSEKNSIRFRRSLYIVEDIPKGGLFTPQNIRSIRPGFGLAPKHIETFLGKTAKQDIKKGTALSWEHLL